MGGWVIQNFSSKGASLVVGKIPKQLSVAGCFGWWKFLLGGL